MRIVMQALGSALILHIGYIGIVLTIGFIQTILYKPQFTPGDIVLQSEVAFGVVGSPLYLIGSYIVITVIVAVILVYLKMKKQRVWKV